MSLLLKAGLGAAAVVVMGLLARTRNYYLAGLVPLFPTFALIAHYIVGTERTIAELKETVLFGMWAMVPYLIYLGAVWFLADRLPLPATLGIATACWLVAALILIGIWSRLG